jgi:hypothetical protein
MVINSRSVVIVRLHVRFESIMCLWSCRVIKIVRLKIAISVLENLLLAKRPSKNDPKSEELLTSVCLIINKQGRKTQIHKIYPTFRFQKRISSAMIAANDTVHPVISLVIAKHIAVLETRKHVSVHTVRRSTCQCQDKSCESVFSFPVC